MSLPPETGSDDRTDECGAGAPAGQDPATPCPCRASAPAGQDPAAEGGCPAVHTPAAEGGCPAEPTFPAVDGNGGQPPPAAAAAYRVARPGHGGPLLFMALFLIGLAITAGIVRNAPQLSREAIVRSGVARDLLAGETRGRQGLVGSLYWAPLPTLLAMPLVRLPEPFGGVGAFWLVALAGSAFLLAFLHRWLKRCGLNRAVRLAVVLALFLSPATLFPAAAGGSQALFALLAMATVIFLMHWWQTEQLRSLAYLAITLSLAILTRYQGLLLFAGALAAVIVHLVRARRRESYAEATLAVFLAPPLYALFVWIISNWLLMGDPWFFLRGLVQRQGWHGWASAAGEGCEWPRVLFLMALPPAAWLLSRAVGRFRHGVPAGLPLVLTALAFWSGAFVDGSRAPSPADEELRAVVARLGTAYRDDWIVVSGYRGYEVAHGLPDEGRGQLQHVLSFYLDPVLESTHQRRAYLLAPRPEGDDRWEDINLKHPDIFYRGARFTVNEKSPWQYWRLLRLVRLDETDRR